MNFVTRNNKVYNKNDNRLQFSSIRLLARLECAHCLTQSTTTEKKMAANISNYGQVYIIYS